MLLAILSCILLFKSVDSVKSCFFCADASSNCTQNDRAIQPVLMNCVKWRITTEERVAAYIVKPLWLKYRGVMGNIYVTQLAENTMKSSCVTINYHNAYESEPNTTGPLTFQSCTYRRFTNYKEPCDFFRQKVFNDTVATNVSCRVCHKRYCNSGGTWTFNFPIIITGFVLATVGL